MEEGRHHAGVVVLDGAVQEVRRLGVRGSRARHQDSTFSACAHRCTHVASRLPLVTDRVCKPSHAVGVLRVPCDVPRREVPLDPETSLRPTLMGMSLLATVPTVIPSPPATRFN